MASKTIAIHVKAETWDRCKKFGVYGDKQDDLLNRVIDLASKYSPPICREPPALEEPGMTPMENKNDSTINN